MIVDLLARNPPIRSFPIQLRFYTLTQSRSVLVSLTRGRVPSGKTHIVSALFVLKLTRVIFPANGPMAVSNGVVAGQIASPSSLQSALKPPTSQVSRPCCMHVSAGGEPQHVRCNIVSVPEWTTTQELKPRYIHSLSVIQIPFENHQARLCQILH